MMTRKEFEDKHQYRMERKVCYRCHKSKRQFFEELVCGEMLKEGLDMYEAVIDPSGHCDKFV